MIQKPMFVSLGTNGMKLFLKSKSNFNDRLHNHKTFYTTENAMDARRNETT
jgi:hypothetical protein